MDPNRPSWVNSGPTTTFHDQDGEGDEITYSPVLDLEINWDIDSAKNYLEEVGSKKFSDVGYGDKIIGDERAREKGGGERGHRAGRAPGFGQTAEQ